MNIAAFPSDAPLNMLTQILAGGMKTCAEAGAVLAGGHTLAGKELRFGLSVTGYIDPGHAACNNGLRPGDDLILTKPLGTGVISTAIKANWTGCLEAEAEMYSHTTHLNANAAHVITAMDLKAATDITGFGLGGHLLEMARGSDVSAEISVASIPLMTRVTEFAEFGLIPGGAYANRRHCEPFTTCLPDADELRALLAFDPQTSGGLLLAVPHDRTDEALCRLDALGEHGTVIGHVMPRRSLRTETLLLC